MLRRFDSSATENFLIELKNTTLFVISEISDPVFKEAGRLKASNRISLADAVALAETSVQGAMLVTCDHHEFDVIEKKEPIKFKWIR